MKNAVKLLATLLLVAVAALSQQPPLRVTQTRYGAAVATPSYNPDGGAGLANDASVTVTDSTPSSSILTCMDTANSCTPTTAYGGAITVTPQGLTTYLRSYATATGYDPSAIKSASYTYKVDSILSTPTLPYSGAAGSLSLATTSTTGAAIHYNTTGPTASCSDTLYSSPISVSSTTTYYAVGCKSNYTDSNQFSGTYTVSGGSAPGVVAYDTVESTLQTGCTALDPPVPSIGTCGNNVSSLTWSHTVASSPIDPLLLVGCTVDAPDSSTLSVTYNTTQTMTSVSKVHMNNSTSGYIELFQLTGPATGAAHDVVVTMTGGPGKFGCISMSLTGVNQTTPLGTPVTAASSGAAVSSGAVTSATNDMVIDLSGSGAGTISSNQTWRAYAENPAAGAAGRDTVMSTADGAASVTMGYTIASDWWAIIAVDVKHD